MGKGWKSADFRNTSKTISQYGQGTWEDLGRGGKTIEPVEALNALKLLMMTDFVL
jgi:hypothetical protein